MPKRKRHAPPEPKFVMPLQAGADRFASVANMVDLKEVIDPVFSVAVDPVFSPPPPNYQLGTLLHTIAIRKIPSMNGNVIGTLLKGTTVKITAIHDMGNVVYATLLDGGFCVVSVHSTMYVQIETRGAII